MLRWGTPPPTTGGCQSRVQRRIRLFLEMLEDRCLPATFTVFNTLDTATAGTLRTAITSANATTGTNTIVFAPSLVGQTITLTAALPTITNGLTITGLGAHSLSVSGGGSFRVFDIAAGVTVNITGLTITGGTVGAAVAGGGVLNNGNLTLDSVTLNGNTAGIAADVGGGAVATTGAGASMTIENSMIENNTDITEGAGAIDNDTGCNASLTNDVIENNTGAGGSGAGIFNDGQMTITNTTIDNNTLTAAGLGGGGIGNAGMLSVTNSTLSGNVSAGEGGGIASDGAVLDLTNSTIVNNTCLGGSGGGGVFVETTGNLTSLNCTITGNIDASGGASNAGGISFTGTGTFTLNNTIVAQNLASASGPPDIRGAVASGSINNFVGIGTAALTGISNGVNGNLIGTSAAPLNPLLGALQNNGGSTWTRAPLSGSPVINAGSNVAAAALTTDQRGFLRIVGPSVDIGAVEFQPSAVTTNLSISPTSPTPANVAVTLTATVSPASGSPAPNNTPTGTVTFLNGTTVLGTGTLNASGVATFTTSSNSPLPVGSDSITAVYGGDFNFGQSVSAVVVQTVKEAVTTAGTYDPTSGTWTMSESNSANGPDLPSFAYGGPGLLPFVGDWEGNGVFTIGVYDPTTSTFYIRLTNTPGAPIIQFAFGAADGTGVPVAGDWSGDGKWGIGVFDTANGSWNLRNELSSGLPDAGSFLYGSPGDKPVVGDWTGSGKFTVGVVENDNGVALWKLHNTNLTGPPDFTFEYGEFADQVLTGDWTGNGVWGPGVVENVGGQPTWLLRDSPSAGAPDIAPFVFGTLDDTALVGSWSFP